jgi:cytoskeletal protein CcmA (bactofilin family)
MKNELKKGVKEFSIILKIILIPINIVNENDYQFQNVAVYTTKKCVGAKSFYVYDWLHRNYMAEEKISTLLSDVSVEGDIVEKDKIVVDAKVTGDIKSGYVDTHANSNIKGNIKAKTASLGGKLKGNISSDKINIKKTADIEGVLNQKTISIEEGAVLKIKTETYK